MEKITCKNVSFAYPQSDNKALTDISFTVGEGEFCLLLGASAAGKSTLLRLLKKEIAPAGAFSGEIEINGTVGYLSQHVEESAVCDKVRSELSFGLTNLGCDEQTVELRVAEIASYFHLEHLLEQSISSLSGGEKQLVNLAAVAVMKPDILLLDEPCSQLDAMASEQLMGFIKKLHRDFGITILMSEHSSREVFYAVDTVLLLEQGRLLIKDDKKAVYDYIFSRQLAIAQALPVSLRLGKYRILPDAEDGTAVETALQIKDLWYAYDKQKDVLSGVNLSVYRGKINAVIGANGSGKSTLLKNAAGVLKPYRGKIKKSGSVSMLTQNVFDLFTKERCGDEVTFGEITDFLGISELEDRHPYDLSGGQAQRLALAKVLERDADIILLDEPTRGLDALLKNKLAALLRRLCAEGKTVLLASHDIDFVGACCDYAAFLSGGRVIASDTRRNFFSALQFYTTETARLTGGKAVSPDDLEVL